MRRGKLDVDGHAAQFVVDGSGITIRFDEIEDAYLYTPLGSGRSEAVVPQPVRDGYGNQTWDSEFREPLLDQSAGPYKVMDVDDGLIENLARGYLDEIEKESWHLSEIKEERELEESLRRCRELEARLRVGGSGGIDGSLASVAGLAEGDQQHLGAKLAETAEPAMESEGLEL